MAPISAPAKPRKTVASRQAAKPVVPALPLPYVKRQAAAAAAAAVAAAAAAPTAAPTAATEIEPKDDNNKQQAANGALQDDAHRTAAEGTPRAAEALAGDASEPQHAASADPSPQGTVAAVAVGPGEPRKPLPATNGPTVAGGPASNNHTGIPPARAAADLSKTEVPAPQPIPEPASETPTKFHGAVAALPKSEPKHMPVQHHTAKLPPSQPRPSMSPTRYQMPPPFQPASRPLGVMANGDMSRGHMPPLPNGPPHMHQAHPSNGSVHFGAFHDSQSSSPAPPHSGGIAPPPGMPLPDGRTPHMVSHNGNGFPPMIPYGAEMMPVNSFDNYGRPAMAYGPMDSYAPYGTLGPSTPHSFHDSQSSAHPEDGAMYNQYPPGAILNGTAGPGDDVQPQGHQGRMFGPPDYPRMMPNPGLPPHMMSHSDDADGLVGFLQQQFASPDIADCTLELRYTDDRAAPVRIPAHRFIFSRSFHLFNLLRKQAFQSSPTDRSLQTLLLETEDKWIRSDSFYMAVQRLYGLPLLHVPPRRSGIDSVDVTDAGTAEDQFNFAISYAAAGHLIDWSPVIRRGCEVATHLLSWQVLERALEFALDGHCNRGSHGTHKYGEGSRILLNAVVTFIVHNLPPHFNLDVEAEELVQYARLPIHPLPPLTPASTVAVPSAPVEGPSVQLGKGRRPQKLSGIQFGDLSFAEGQNGSATETPKATRQAQPASYTVLSRILLNIPFAQLKMILESSGSGNVNGWANAESRYRIIKAAIDERESRRRQALDLVLGGRVPDADIIRTGLRSPEPRDLGRWSVLGWQEDMLPYGNPDGPSLARKWVPLMEPQNGPVAEYP